MTSVFTGNRKPRVVIVDDSRTIQALLDERFSNRIGWDVIGIASSASEGIRLVRHLRPDVVTVDIQLPGEDGFFLLEAMSNLPEICKIIIASDFESDLALARRARDLGVAMCVDKKWIMQKPGDLCAKLSNTVSSHLRHRHLVKCTKRDTNEIGGKPIVASYPIPFDEKERLNLVDRLGFESDDPDFQLDLVVRHLSKVIDFPAVILTIMGREFQWIKAAVGIPVGRTSRQDAFCNYTICGDGLLSVPNTLLDQRFSTNSLVTTGPMIRSYFGCPIIGHEGVKLGALCAIDTKPRKECAKLVGNLEDLAQIASSMINSRVPATGLHTQ